MESLLVSSQSHSSSPPSAASNASSQTVHPSQTTTTLTPPTSNKIVERCFLVNLDRRDDRLREWMGQWFAADDAACERLQRSLLDHRERFIKANPKVPVLRVDFAELTKNPTVEIAKLVEFLGIDPTEEELESAIAHVNPELRKFD